MEEIAQVGLWKGTGLTSANIRDMYLEGPGLDWNTSFSTNMKAYWTFGNQTGQGTDTSSTIYDQGTAYQIKMQHGLMVLHQLQTQDS